MKDWIPYKDTFAAKGSPLHEALTAGDAAKAKAIYEETELRYNALVRPEFRQYNKKEKPP